MVSSGGVRISGNADTYGGVKLASNDLGLNSEYVAHEFSHNLNGAIRRDPAQQIPISADEMRNDLAIELNDVLQKLSELTGYGSKYPEILEPLSQHHIEEMTNGGITFGAHTASHPILTRMPYNKGFEEIAESKRFSG